MADEVAQAIDTSEKSLIDQIIEEHHEGAGALLGILEDVQQANSHKYLSIAALRYIAAATGTPPAQVYSVATFYSLFNLEPKATILSASAEEQPATRAVLAICSARYVSISG